MEKRLIIAIDGPAASGKSTTAQRLAKLLGYAYLDTGAMYRACALQAKQAGIDLSDEQAVKSMLDTLDIKIEYSEQANIILLNGRDVSADIRENDISALASAISAIPAVRYKLVELQRKMAASGGVILDGRDIGTFVFPDADIKFYLTAAAEVRARRRCLELQAKGIDAKFETVLADLIQRDSNDQSRALAPLAVADDAIVTDTSEMDVDTQVKTLYKIILERLAEPKILLAQHSGFCFGVRRAIQMALDSKQEGKEVCTFGELIHNPQIVRELEQQGIGVCEQAQQLHDKVVVIRSHGITKTELEALQAGNNEIIDATCPYVKRAQELVASMSDYPVMILGNPEHPEVIGMRSYGGENTRIVSPNTDFGGETWKKLCVVCQTTQKLSALQALVTKLLPNVVELRVFNTICLATTKRQESAVALAKISELMVVIGGRKSANTNMLQDLCQAETRSVHIETEEELNPALLIKARRIGLVAGASTPPDTIIKVYNKIKQINGNSDTATYIEEIPLFKEESC